MAAAIPFFKYASTSANFGRAAGSCAGRGGTRNHDHHCRALMMHVCACLGTCDPSTQADHGAIYAPALFDAGMCARNYTCEDVRRALSILILSEMQPHRVPALVDQLGEDRCAVSAPRARVGVEHCRHDPLRRVAVVWPLHHLLRAITLSSNACRAIATANE